MWIAYVYNYRAGDTFVTSATTKEKAVSLMVETYSNYYGMNDDDAMEIAGCETMEEYLYEEQSMYVLKATDGLVMINREEQE